MSKSAHRTTHQLKSLTLLLSLASGADIADLQGQRARLTVPLNNLEYDGEPGRAAWFYAIAETQLGSGSSPAPAGIVLRETGRHIRAGSDADDPRQSVVSRLVFDLEFSSDAASFADVPLVVKGFHAASNAPAAFSLPSFSADAGAKLKATDADGGAVGVTAVISPLSSDGSDKNFVYTQMSPATTWNIAHNLGKYPAITIVDSGGSVVTGDIAHTDTSNAVVTFSAAFAGKAFCN